MLATISIAAACMYGYQVARSKVQIVPATSFICCCCYSEDSLTSFLGGAALSLSVCLPRFSSREPPCAVASFQAYRVVSCLCLLSMQWCWTFPRHTWTPLVHLLRACWAWRCCSCLTRTLTSTDHESGCGNRDQWGRLQQQTVSRRFQQQC